MEEDTPISPQTISPVFFWISQKPPCKTRTRLWNLKSTQMSASFALELLF